VAFSFCFFFTEIRLETVSKAFHITDCGLAKYRLTQMFNYNTKACGGILPNHCYKPFLFVFGLTF